MVFPLFRNPGLARSRPSLSLSLSLFSPTFSLSLSFLKKKQPQQQNKQGLCDNLLSSVVRAWDWEAKPLLLAPAMNTAMWASPLTGKHLGALKAMGAGVVPPIAKALACGDVGMGAMAEPEEVAVAVKGALGLA